MAPLEVVFETPSGEITKAFEARPLGMEFVQRMPIVITLVRGEAAKLDVKKGWKVKAIGGEALANKTFPQAWALLCKAVEPLPQEFIMRDFPHALAAVADCRERLGPLEAAQVVPFLGRFGFVASDPEKWATAEQPKLRLGVIDGHREDGNPSPHTWYALHGCLQLAGSGPRHWQVERRLVHLRSLVHDPARKELGGDYDRLFEGTHFARRGGPSGTTARLEAWLTTFSKLVNEGKLSPSLVAATLRFFEAPEQSEASRSWAVGAGTAGTEEPEAPPKAEPADVSDSRTEDGDGQTVAGGEDSAPDGEGPDAPPSPVAERGFLAL